jgi:Cupredoxin-like domain
MPRRPFIKSILTTTAAISLIAMCAPSFASGTDAEEIRFDNGRFEPLQLVVPANVPFSVRVTNADKAAIEFESFELHRERVVRPGQTITVLMAPVAPGSYKFFDDFHHDVAEGAILAK